MSQLTDASPLLLTIQKAAERVGVTPQALTATARRGGHLIKMGNRFYVKSSELEQIIEIARMPAVEAPENRAARAADLTSGDKVKRAYEAAQMLKNVGEGKKRQQVHS